MKYYYNGKLVRTSKTHTYKYGVFTKENTLKGCARDLKLAENTLNQIARTPRHNIEYYKETIKAIEKGNDKFYIGRNLCKVTCTKEYCEERIKDLQEFVDGLHIEELMQKD